MTDIWELYHQTGPDGQEWGVKIRPGYVVTGFAREDAEAVVAWQNAAVSRPANDILERAKASGLYGKYIIQKTDGLPVDSHADYFVLRLDTDPYARIAALEYAIQTDNQKLGEALTKRVLDHVYSEDDQCRKRAEAWPLGMIKKLRGEVERLRDIIDRPPEEAEWMTDYHLLYSALDGPIIDAARKWHAAYRKAQNSNLIRSEGLATRIKELEAELIGRKQECQACMAHGESAYMQRLEAAFLEVFAKNRYHEFIIDDMYVNEGKLKQSYRDELKAAAEKQAREELERIRRCGKG